MSFDLDSHARLHDEREAPSWLWIRRTGTALTPAFSQGAGHIGLYNDVSFSIPGTSEFTPGPDATPAIGQRGQKEQVQEVKFEISSTGEERTRAVVKAIRDVHPYEEVVVDVYKLEDF